MSWQDARHSKHVSSNTTECLLFRVQERSTGTNWALVELNNHPGRDICLYTDHNIPLATPMPFACLHFAGVIFAKYRTTAASISAIVISSSSLHQRGHGGEYERIEEVEVRASGRLIDKGKPGGLESVESNTWAVNRGAIEHEKNISRAEVGNLAGCSHRLLPNGLQEGRVHLGQHLLALLVDLGMARGVKEEVDETAPVAHGPRQ